MIFLIKKPIKNTDNPAYYYANPYHDNRTILTCISVIPLHSGTSLSHNTHS